MTKIPTTRRKTKSEIKRSLLEREERKVRHNGPQEGDGGEGLCLHSQEGQDLCACAGAEELIFNTSSEHQTVDLSNKCMTKDFLRDFRHGCTVHPGQEDRTFDMKMSVDTRRYRPLMIHVRVCAQRSSATKTQGNLVCPGFSKPHTDDGTKALIFRVGDLVVMQKRCLRLHF